MNRLERMAELRKELEGLRSEATNDVISYLDGAVCELGREEVINCLSDWLAKNGVTIKKGGKIKADNSREEMETIERIQAAAGKQISVDELRELFGDKRYAYMFGMSKILKYKDANKTMIGLGPKGVPHLKKLKDMAG